MLLLILILDFSFFIIRNAILDVLLNLKLKFLFILDKFTTNNENITQCYLISFHLPKFLFKNILSYNPKSFLNFFLQRIKCLNIEILFLARSMLNFVFT